MWLDLDTGGDGLMTPMMIAGYLAHAENAGYRRRVDAARQMIADHPGYAVSCSWGKDSLCILHMVLDVHGSATAVHARYSENEELPDIPKVRDSFLNRFPVDYREISVWGDWEIYERAGRFFLEPETKEERKIVSDWHQQLVEGLDKAVIDLGASGKILGLAAHESRARTMNIRKRGAHYKTKFEILPKLLPIAHWHPADVWAYMLSYDLPRLRIYDMANNPERARSEVAFAAIGAGADAIRRHGAWQEWSRCYPELWAKWVLRYPEISSL